MVFRDFFSKFKKEETIEQRVDPVVEQRRKEKFSAPLIYDDEPKVSKEEKDVKKVEKPVAKKPRVETTKTYTYTMSEIISPMTGKKPSSDVNGTPAVKKIRKKRVTNINDQLIPVISPFYGAQPEKEEIDIELQNIEPKKQKRVKLTKTEKKAPDSVTENLRNLANLIQEEENQLKIIEARTGEFQLDFSNMNSGEKTLIDEIDDEMTLDELMSLYEKKKSQE